MDPSTLLGGTAPSDAANQYLNQMPGQILPYMSPYLNAGSQSLGSLQNQYGQLLNNPGGMINQIGQNYHQSPGFQFALKQSLMGANNASSAGGMAGSPMSQQQNMGLATQMGNQDYYNWLGQATGMYNQGLQGQQGLAGLGMQAGTNMSNVIANQLAQQASNAYANQQSQNSQNSNIWGDVAGVGADIIGL